MNQMIRNWELLNLKSNEIDLLDLEFNSFFSLLFITQILSIQCIPLQKYYFFPHIGLLFFFSRSIWSCTEA